jgi:hypothetical protein
MYAKIKGLVDHHEHIALLNLWLITMSYVPWLSLRASPTMPQTDASKFGQKNIGHSLTCLKYTTP